MYVARWRIETVYRTLQSKGTGLDKHGGRECTIRHVIAAACLEHLLLRVQELQATQATRSASAAQHKAWASATSTKHHRRLVRHIMRHLQPVAPRRRRLPRRHQPHPPPPDPAPCAMQAFAFLVFATAAAIQLLNTCTQLHAQLQAQSAALHQPHTRPSTAL
jgi:hypothetical protein